MYPKEYFVEQFADLDTEALLFKLSGDLADNARDAVVTLLGQRGITAGQLDARTKATQKANIRRPRGTIECDYCGNSAKKKPLFDQGQQFCSADCLHAARISEAAVDLSAGQIGARALAMRSGACPDCGSSESVIEIRYHYRVVSALYFTSYQRKSRFCCVACGRKQNFKSFLFTFFLGWWGVPFGLIMTPTYLIANLGELREQRSGGEPSEDLVRLAKFQLAEKAYRLNYR
ncbi:hypothetical protein [Massilia sp. TWP1-3-3]|uniref:hypothetical protein n=1 Tax=Massilia sp. TWP1-3-3 TaxID=2804573 RepID=UPI003CECFD8C